MDEEGGAPQRRGPRGADIAIGCAIVLACAVVGAAGGAYLGSQEPVDDRMMSIDSPFLHEVVGGFFGALGGGTVGLVMVVLFRALPD